MPGLLSNSTNTNEERKFVQSGSQVAIAVAGANGASLSAGSFWTMDYDTVTVAYPDAVTEVYSSRIGGAGGSVQEVVTIIYVDSSKEQLVSVVRS
jgi:hypothetical protein